jgi:hypothetical protein
MHTFRIIFSEIIVLSTSVEREPKGCNLNHRLTFERKGDRRTFQVELCIGGAELKNQTSRRGGQMSSAISPPLK